MGETSKEVKQKVIGNECLKCMYIYIYIEREREREREI
jgi:hypothetical protein